MANFIRPEHDPILIACAKLLLPLALRNAGLEVGSVGNSLSTLYRLRHSHCVILVNHSDRYDPLAVFAFSKLSKQDFYYLAARELFDECFGVRGLIMRRCGAYSVIRGEPADVDSSEVTVSLIAEGDKRLVTFPEGDVTGRDDLILPLKKDGIHNLFRAQQRLLRKGNLPLFLVPLAIHYRVRANDIALLGSNLRTLEPYLDLPPSSGTPQNGIETALDSMTQQLAALYGHTSQQLDLPTRLRRLCRHITRIVSEFNGVEVDCTLSETAQLYSLRGALQRRIATKQLCTRHETYTERLSRQSVQSAQESLPHLNRAQDLLIMASTLEQTSFTNEVAWRLIDRLQLEVIGRAGKKGTRTINYEAAAPINLMPLWREYECDPEEAVERTEALIRGNLQSALQTAKAKQPLSSDFYRFVHRQ